MPPRPDARRGLKIVLVTPAPPRTRHGNRITALRWAAILRELGHPVTVAEQYGGEPCDLMIALHARRSYPAMQAYRERWPRGPLVLALTGTDVYRDIRTSREAQAALRMAGRLVVLQPLAAAELPAGLRDKVRVIYQSAEPAPRGVRRARRGFPVCVVGHLRAEKDPFRAAQAVRRLPAASRIRILHLGKAMDEAMARRAAAEAARNPRYRWLGEQPRWKVRRMLARARLMVLSSRMEGGANVISEAVAAGLPVLASRISGSVGLLGEDYPGYFPVGATAALRELLLRAEREPAFLAELTARVKALQPRFRPAAERKAWRDLLVEAAG